MLWAIGQIRDGNWNLAQSLGGRTDQLSEAAIFDNYDNALRRKSMSLPGDHLFVVRQSYTNEGTRTLMFFRENEEEEKKQEKKQENRMFRKTTGGYMQQIFDSKTGKFISQGFEASDYDGPEWEHLDGRLLEEDFWDEKQFGKNGPYLPFPSHDDKL